MNMKFKEFPYKKLQATEAWGIVDGAIEQLVENKDLVETTARRYIIGFILKQLNDNKLLKKDK
jgi:hypothetical protein